MGVFLVGLAYVFKDFSCWTSTHGIPHIGNANAKALRLFWILVVFICTAAFIWQFVTLMQAYFAYRVNTETKLQFAERVFPMVTICHLNPWRADTVGGIDADMKKLMDAYVDASGNYPAESNYNFPNGLTGSRQSQAMAWMLLYAERLKSEHAEDPQIAYSYDDLVISCTYNADTCNITDFDEYYNPSYGICQQFNVKGDYLSSRAGPLYGLRMVIKTNQSTYLPWIESSGVILSINSQGEMPFPDVMGYFAPPGTASSLGVRYVSTSRMSKPYGDCTLETELMTTQYSGIYSMEACFRSCLQDKIIAQCGCYDPAYSHAENDTSTPSCDGYGTPLNNLNCIDSINNADSSDFNLLTECDCPQPCDTNTYGVTVSTAQWPSNAYTPTECNQKPYDSKPWSDIPGCLDWYKENTLLFEVYYERMNYQVLTESPAYSVVNLVSDIGGQVGLFLGMSIISLLEFFALFLLLLCYCTTHKQRKVELEQLHNDIKKAKQNADKVEAKRKKREMQNRELYDGNDTTDPVPPPVAQSN